MFVYFLFIIRTLSPFAISTVSIGKIQYGHSKGGRDRMVYDFFSSNVIDRRCIEMTKIIERITVKNCLNTDACA